MIYSYFYKIQADQSKNFKTINTYSNIADYTINWNKSTIVPVHVDSSQCYITNPPFFIFYYV